MPKTEKQLLRRKAKARAVGLSPQHALGHLPGTRMYPGQAPRLTQVSDAISAYVATVVRP